MLLPWPSALMPTTIRQMSRGHEGQFGASTKAAETLPSQLQRQTVGPVVGFLQTRNADINWPWPPGGAALQGTVLSR